MMKKASKISVLLFVLIAVFSACINDHDEPVFSIYDEPAVVESVGAQPVIRTAYGKYSVPALANASVGAGDLLWVAFIVDMNNQPSRDLLTAQSFRYEAIDSTNVTIPADSTEFVSFLSDSYSDSIAEAVMYNTYIDSMLFFGFRQAAPENGTFDYEMVCNPDLEDGKNIPTLYIRTKKINAVRLAAPSHVRRNTVFGFRMSEYVQYYRKHVSGSGPVRFNLKYKIGTGRDGKDVYREFRSNPLSWNIK
jgi:hypothetical protein